MKFDENGKPIIETTDSTIVENTDDSTKSATPSSTLDAKAIEQIIAKQIEQAFLKFKTVDTAVTPKVEQTVTPKMEQTGVDFNSKIAELETKLTQKYEKQFYFSSLTQSQKDFLSDIEGYENLSINQIKKILSKVSLPALTVTNEEAKGETFEEMMAQLNKINGKK